MNKNIHTGARLILGLVFVIFGLNGFLHFMPNPTPTAEAGALFVAFGKTGYFFPMIKSIEVLVGGMFLTNLFAPLAAVIITPVLVGITTIHLFLNPSSIPLMIILHVLHGIIVFGYKKNYQGLLVKKV